MCYRANQFRVSSTASSIFFLQNDAAVKQWPVLQEHIEAITDAFRPRKPASEGRIGSSTGKQHANDLMLYGELSSTMSAYCSSVLHDHLLASVAAGFKVVLYVVFLPDSMYVAGDCV